jgi:hypothetical protein
MPDTRFVTALQFIEDQFRAGRGRLNFEDLELGRNPYFERRDLERVFRTFMSQGCIKRKGDVFIKLKPLLLETKKRESKIDIKKEIYRNRR